MKSLTVEEARNYCTQSGTFLSINDSNSLYYDTPEEHSFSIKHPPEYRRMLALTYELLTFSSPDSFYGGMIWLQGWQLGVNEMIRPGWRILEDMRRAHGDQRSLDLAPAQYFRHDEFVELHAYLVQVMGNGWPACYLPSGSCSFFEFRSSERFLCYSKDSTELDKLYSKLSSWGPAKENRDG